MGKTCIRREKEKGECRERNICRDKRGQTQSEKNPGSSSEIC